MHRVFRQRHLAAALLAALWVVSLAGCRDTFWAPDSKSIVLDVDGKLRVFRVGRGQFETLDTQGRYIVSPAYAPDGRSLAYYGLTHKGDLLQSADLYIRELATQTERRITTRVISLEGRDPVTKQPERPALEEAALTLRMIASPAWSPDGRRLAYPRENQYQYRIEVVDVGTGATASLAVKGQQQASPAWSPDGTHIAYLTGKIERPKDGTKSSADLWLIDADGRNPRRLLASTPRFSIWPFGPPIWTKDGGGIIVFTDPVQPGAGAGRMREPDIADAFAQDVRVVPVAGGAGQVLARFPSAMGMIAPDLKSLVYLGGKEHTQLIYKTAPFKTARILDQIPDAVPEDGPPDDLFVFPVPLLSPDGKAVALRTNHPKTGRPELRLYDLASRTKRIYAIPR